MRKYFLTCIFLSILCLNLKLAAQSYWSLEILADAAPGWWIYDKGINEQGSHEGYDQTHLAPFVSLGAKINFHLNSWQLGLLVQHSALFSDEMRQSDHSYNVYSKYPIASEIGAAHFTTLAGNLAHVLVTKQNFRTGAELALGPIWVNSAHPLEEDFGNKWYAQAGLFMHWRLKGPLWFTSGIHYHAWRIKSEVSDAREAMHRLHALGLQAGLRLEMRAK